MIVLKYGEPEKPNATVVVEGEEIIGEATIIEGGHVDILVDMLEPKDGSHVKITLHDLNNSEYKGTLKVDGNRLIFQPY